MFWLYAVEGYHCVMPSLSAAQREHIETNLFQVMADDALNRHNRDFDIVHNHGIWSVAAAAISGYVLDDASLVEKALYGLKGDSESGGFFAQLSQLFRRTVIISKGRITTALRCARCYCWRRPLNGVSRIYRLISSVSRLSVKPVKP